MIKIIFVLFMCIYSLYAKDITLGIVPQQSPLKLSKTWLEITKYLNEQTGLNIVFKTEKSIPEFEKKLYEGSYDLAYMNPYHFIVANEKQNYEAFLRAKKNIVGILVSKDDNVDFSFENLKGKKFLFPAPNAFAATLLAKFELKNKYNFDIDEHAEVLYVNSHDSVYKGVSRDVGYIGGGIVRTFNSFVDTNDKEKIKIVYTTQDYPSHPFAYNPKIPTQIVEKIQDAFMKMPKELKDTLSIKEFKIINSSEYDVIKDIKLK